MTNDDSTCDVVAEYPGRDDVAARREQPLQVRLSHVLGQARHVQVGALDGLAAGASVRNLAQRSRSISILYYVPTQYMYSREIICEKSFSPPSP